MSASSPERVAEVAAAPGAGEAGATEFEVYRPSLLESMRESWRHRRVLRDMAAEVGLFQFRSTVLGFWWIPVLVLFDTVGKALIFGRILNVPSAYGIPYLLFLSTGTMAWWLFNRTLIYTMRSFTRFRRLARDLYVPLALVPIASMWQTAFEFGFYAIVLLGYFGVFWAMDGELYLHLSPELLFAPLGYLWLLLFVLGIGFFTAPIFMRARDIRFATRIGLPFMMYVTPIIYPLSELGGTAGLFARLNPLAAPVETVKLGVLGVGVLPWYSIAVSLSATVALLVGGLAFLNRYGLRMIGVETFDDDDDDFV